MQLDLDLLRQEINETDKEIVELFKKRMNIASSVAEYKSQRIRVKFLSCHFRNSCQKRTFTSCVKYGQIALSFVFGNA